MTLVRQIIDRGAAHGLSLYRASPRGTDRLVLEFRDRDGAVIAGQWHRDPERGAATARRTAMASARGSFDVTVLDRPDLFVQRRGADRRLPALAQLANRQGSLLVSHRAERRGVVRLADGDFVKVVPPEKVAAVVTGCSVTSANPSLALPRVVGVDPESGTVTTAAMSGRTLESRLTDSNLSDDELVTDAKAVGAALREFHEEGPLPTALPRHDTAAELAVTERWLNAATGFGLVDPDRWTSTLARAVDLLDERPTDPVRVHRDLHDKQLVLEVDQPVGLLDLDLVTSGEAAVDIANLLVHLELRHRLGGCTTTRAERCAEAFLTGYAPTEPTLARIGGYMTTTRLRLAGVYAFRDSPQGLLDDLVDSCFEKGLPS